ncbi:TRAP transporter permease [Halobacillus karajensis]|uniref:Neu5Ac permease n=1 Tax=Halobacillus karajensis TaxID=195088 RepID=A0A024P3P2_9BACI|nr:TRAP transporter permease [Halobacillus karajensis]CDQ19049.1 Neu5Ac permease [Halobacillus karajensis]CDQ22877.1 Neu5Ac permease [Halobacillus karajensis]CDQ26359.1 Neu5Ac permease [Halobacillus karajensis]
MEATDVKKLDTTIKEKPAHIETLWHERKKKWNGARLFILIISLLAIGLSIFHVYTAGFGTLPSWQQRSVHVLWALLLIFLLFPFRKGKKFGLMDVLIVGLTIVTAYYMITGAEMIQSRQGNISHGDVVFGTIFIALVLEATRRTNGILMSLIGVFFIAYIFLGRYFPGALAHPGVRYEKMIDHMFNGTLGVFSAPIYVSSTVLILFVIFGSFLMKSGGGQFFTDFAFGLFGNKTGGPALSAVGSSALVATITGNGAANAAITGSFTIPLMKKLGYSKRFSAAVEAVASQGGQIMPPIMGASVFIMAETIGIPYIQIALFALIPAVIYFFIAGMVVYYHAKRLEMAGIPKEKLPNLRTVLLKQSYLFLPILLIIGLMIYGYSPMKAGFYAIVATIVLSWIRTATRMSLLDILAALENGAKNALVVIAACATAGIIVGAVSLTGLGITFSRFVIDVAGGSLILLLILVAGASIIMGMGMPTVSAYVILAVLGAPALIDLGVNVVAAHMFVFYFGVLSGLTPPVAITAYTTAGIAGSNPTKTALYAMKIGLGGFFIPFLFVYNPELLLQGGDTTRMVIAVASAFLSCLFFAGALEDYFIGPLGVVKRVVLFVSAILLVMPGLVGDLIGLALVIFLILWQKRSSTYVSQNSNQMSG